MIGTPEEIMRSALAFFASQRSFDPGIRQIAYKALKDAYPAEEWHSNLEEHDKAGDKLFDERLKYATERLRSDIRKRKI
jgi:hypothetical protein